MNGFLCALRVRASGFVVMTNLQFVIVQHYEDYARMGLCKRVLVPDRSDKHPTFFYVITRIAWARNLWHL